MSRLPVVLESQSHVLAEFDCLDPLLSALRLDSGRLKCTCLAVTRKWLALGTSAGGLHLIQREGWKQKLILTHKEGSITQVACCPHDEDFIAVSTSQGLVVVWELQMERRGRPERVSVSWEHRGQAVTSLCWDTTALKVFVGDAGGKVSFLRAGSSKLGKGSAFVIFPVQTITTVDSKVVQLGYQDGHLLVSSLSRCYLCDTEREKFWRVGNKERDGEYGACFFPQSRGPGAGQPPLLYCARPGSRVWEASFNGEVLSTHQFKQLLSCPPVPLITHRNEPQYHPEQKRPQSLAFPKLLHFGEQNLITWTDSAIYVFTPQSGQVVLWTEVKDLVDIAVYRNELFCLHGNGHLSHLCLIPVERCVERLLRREAWPLAAAVCCMFQHALTPCRARKSVPIERLEHLRAQLSPSTHQELIGQLEEVIARAEPLDSASSSRRSSISSHESFNVLDCGIYRVISRRGSQSDEETGSLINQSASEEERLRELGFRQEEEQQADHDAQGADVERADPGAPFHLPRSFRPKPPRIALQAVKDSVSSFVKKTTEKINTLQMNSDLWQRPDLREGGQEVFAASVPLVDEAEKDPTYEEESNKEAEMNELRTATERALSQISDPSVLLDPTCLTAALLEWLSVLERILGPDELQPADEGPSSLSEPSKEESDPDGDAGSQEQTHDTTGVQEQTQDTTGVQERTQDTTGVPEDNVEPSDGGGQSGSPPTPPPAEKESVTSNGTHAEPIQLEPPKHVPPDLLTGLSQLGTLYAELSCFKRLTESRDSPAVRCTTFLHRYFFLLQQARVRQMCLLCHQEQPEVQGAFMEAMLEVTQSSKVVEVIEKGDLQRSLKSLRELQPQGAPPLLAHLHRLYEKHGEIAVRSMSQFYPTITPADVMTMARRSHFLPYLDNLVQAHDEDERLSFLESLIDPESLRQDWLELAITHDAPQRSDTVTDDGQPRWHSHHFRWGYGRLLSLLIRLPADLPSKEKMAEVCRSHGYWTGYLHLCSELQRRSDAFATICRLDDISLLEEPNGVCPHTLDEWKLLIQLSQESRGGVAEAAAGVNGGTDSVNGGVAGVNGGTDGVNGGTASLNGGADGVNGGTASVDSPCRSRAVNPENLILRLARNIGPDRAMAFLEECGVQLVLSPHSRLVCELLKLAEKRQRALIQTMLERCDRFLWSQHA